MMRALSFSDLLFLALENKKQPMHVAGVCIFELPENSADDFVSRLANSMQQDNITPCFPFNQKLHKKIFWRDDNQFDIQHHFRHVRLPSPADMNALLDYIACEYSRMLDKTKPLWQLHLIEGLQAETAGRPKRFVIYLKIHHALTDGIAAMRLLQKSLSDFADNTHALPLWTLQPSNKSNTGNALTPNNTPNVAPNTKQSHAIHNIAHAILANTPPPSLTTVMQRLYQRYQDRHLDSFVSPWDAPPSLLNQRLGKTRTVLVKSFAKARFEAIAKRFNTSANNVILAVCAGALRRYLLHHNALPTKPLTAFVPISLRQDDSVSGNQLSFLLANLGTHQACAKARLMSICQSIQDSKSRFNTLNYSQAICYSVAIYAAAGLNLATGLYPKKQGFNLIISSIPGAKTPLYLNGARLTAIYPISVLFAGQALNITFTNHQGKIDFGIIACDTALPDITQLTTYLEQELYTFETLDNNQALE